MHKFGDPPHRAQLFPQRRIRGVALDELDQVAGVGAPSVRQQAPPAGEQLCQDAGLLDAQACVQSLPSFCRQPVLEQDTANSSSTNACFLPSERVCRL